MNPNDPVTAALVAYRAAVYAKDVDAFCALYDADVHVFDMWGQWQQQGLAAWREMAQGWFSSVGDELVIVEITKVHAEQAGELAFGHACLRFSAQAADGTTLRSMSNRLTLAMRQRAGQWKIVHQHTSAPIDPSSGKPVMQR
jgi:ketosteroid isomerase-like protein